MKTIDEKLLINSLIDILKVPKEDYLEYERLFPAQNGLLINLFVNFLNTYELDNTHVTYIKAMCAYESLVNYLYHDQCLKTFIKFIKDSRYFIDDYLAYPYPYAKKCDDCGKICEQKCINYLHLIKK